MKKLILAIILLFWATVSNYAQGEAALPYLGLSQSMQSFGTGGSGVSFVTTEPSGYYFNPAILGSTSKESHIAFSFLPSKTKWIERADDHALTRTNALNLGYNLENYFGLPVSVGLGFINDEIDYKNISEMDQFDKFSSYSLGVNLDYLVSISLGLTYKSYESTLTKEYKADGSVLDFGLLMEISSKRLLSNYSFWKFGENNFRPKIDFAVGYSVSNIGDEVDFGFDNQKDPLPRTARLGYSLKAGLDYKFNDSPIELFSYTFIAEASDVLVKERSVENNDIKYQSISGGFRLVDNFIHLENDKNINIHMGNVFNFFETVSLTFGRTRGEAYSNVMSSAIGVSTRGLFKLLSNTIDNENLKYLFDHFIIEYYTAKMNEQTFAETEMSSLNIRFVGFTF